MSIDINPHEPKLVDELPRQFPDGWLCQEKIDGGRILAVVDGNARLYTKRGIDRTHQFPEVVAQLEKVSVPCILDGEMAVKVNGVWNFSKGYQRRLTETPFRIQWLSKEMPATYNVFDVVQVDDRDLRNMTLAERINILSDLDLPDSAYTRRIPFYQDASQVLAMENTEGIIWKDPNSIYEDSGKRHRRRSGTWRKFRWYEDKKVDVIDLEHTDDGVTVTVADGDQQHRVAIHGRKSHEAIRRWEHGGFKILMRIKEAQVPGEKRFPRFKQFIDEEEK